MERTVHLAFPWLVPCSCLPRAGHRPAVSLPQAEQLSPGASCGRGHPLVIQTAGEGTVPCPWDSRRSLCGRESGDRDRGLDVLAGSAGWHRPPGDRSGRACGLSPHRWWLSCERPERVDCGRDRATACDSASDSQLGAVLSRDARPRSSTGPAPPVPVLLVVSLGGWGRSLP